MRPDLEVSDAAANFLINRDGRSPVSRSGPNHSGVMIVRGCFAVQFARVGQGKPRQGLLKIRKSPDRKSPQRADEGEPSSATVRVAGVKDSQAMIVGESRVAVRLHQRHQIFGGEIAGHIAHIQKRAFQPAQAAGLAEQLQCFPAFFQVNMPLPASADEFARSDDLKVKWHKV